jgi:voltage-gated potassium channel
MRIAVTSISLLLVLTIVGTVGFFLTMPDATWLDSLYQAVITLTTVGSRDAGGTVEGKIFVICYLAAGLSVFTFSAFQLGNVIVSASFRHVFERRRMDKQIALLEGHSIICGHGRMGRTICHYLQERGKPFVVVDVDEERIEETCPRFGWHYVVGDATLDETLIRAGVERAEALTTVLETDADNLYVVLSANMLNGKLKIIARASDDKAIQKLERAGATRVVSPFRSGAVKMARFMLNPSVEDFLEIADSHGNELELVDLQITGDSPYAGTRLSESDLRSRGIMVIGIRRENGEQLMPAPGDAMIQENDSLFVFGNSEAVNSLLATDV